MREIYLIDRSDIDCFVTKKLLELWLTDVSIVSNLKTTDILQRAESGMLYDPIILVDVDLPLTTVAEFAAKLAQFNSKFSIYILSHFLNIHSIRSFHNLYRIKDYITKPIDRKDVVKIANENKLCLSKLIT